MASGKIEKVWLVRTPIIGFELDDVLCELTVNELVNVIRGSFEGSWEYENTKLYTNKKSAEQDAEARIADKIARIIIGMAGKHD